MKKKKLKLFAVILCFTLVLVACDKKKSDIYTKSNPAEKVTESVNNEPVEDSAKKDEVEPTVIVMSELTATSNQTAPAEPTATPTATLTPEPTATPTVTPIPKPTESPYLNVNTGDTIIFGSYEQDNDLSNGKEPIEWIVLSNDGEKLLVLSKYLLDYQKYNTKNTDITWENCSLRVWLNTEFYNNAFSDVEKAAIIKCYLTNKNNPVDRTDGGNDTYDDVFLLSIDDLTNTNYGFSGDYKEYDVARRCAPTAYTIAQGVWLRDEFRTSDGEYSCWWWLRSPGDHAICATYVDYGGDLFGHGIAFYFFAVRPALYIDLNP